MKKIALALTGVMLATSASAANLTLYFSGVLSYIQTDTYDSTTGYTSTPDYSPYTDRVTGDSVTGKIIIGVPDTYTYNRYANGGNWTSNENFIDFQLDSFTTPAWYPNGDSSDTYIGDSAQNSNAIDHGYGAVDDLYINSVESNSSYGASDFVNSRYVYETAALFLKPGALNRAFLPSDIVELNLDNLLSSNHDSIIQFATYLSGDGGNNYNNTSGLINLNSLSVAPVPLPAAAWLFLSGLGGMALMARRRRQAGVV